MGNHKHIAALGFPFGSHAGPLLCLIRRLSLAKPDIKFSFFSTELSNNKLFSKTPAATMSYFDDKIKPYNVDSGLPPDYVYKDDPTEPVALFLKNAHKSIMRCIKEAVAETEMEITCVVSDAFLWFAEEIAEALHVPWVPLWTAGPRSLLVHIDTDLLREKLGIDGPGEQTLGFLPGFSRIRAMDLPEGVVSGDIESTFSTMTRKMGHALRRATAIAINSFEELDSIAVDTVKSRMISKKFLNIGPFALAYPLPEPDPHGCLAWLEEHSKKPASVVYISFGSIVTPPPHELKQLAEALEISGYAFLWSLRGKAEEQLPLGFIERTKTNGNGKIVQWAPQLEVLAHSSVGVFVTHCGWNSIQEGIIGGVPMICRSFFGDQGLNHRMVEEEWGIGAGLGGVNFTKGLVSALKTILTTEEGMLQRAKIARLKELAFKAVEPTGSSTANFAALLEIINSSINNDI